MMTINSELQIVSSIADDYLIESGKNPDFLEKAARTMNKAFSVCATDRYSALDESRKWVLELLYFLIFRVFLFKLMNLF